MKRIGAAILGLAIAGFVWHMLETGLVSQLFDHEQSAAEKVDALREYFLSFGIAAPLAYIAFVITEVVVAPIPGAFLYAPGGAIFGGFWGGLLALTGNVVGAGIACRLIRVLGQKRFERMAERRFLAPLKTKIDDHGTWIIVLLRLNPLTSSDLIAHAAGLTAIPVHKVMLATLIGMMPLCFAQAYLAESLLGQYHQLIYPLAAVCALCLIFTGIVFWRISRRPARASNAASS